MVNWSLVSKVIDFGNATTRFPDSSFFPCFLGPRPLQNGTTTILLLSIRAIGSITRDDQRLVLLSSTRHGLLAHLVGGLTTCRTDWSTIASSSAQLSSRTREEEKKRKGQAT